MDTNQNLLSQAKQLKQQGYDDAQIMSLLSKEYPPEEVTAALQQLRFMRPSGPQATAASPPSTERPARLSGVRLELQILALGLLLGYSTILVTGFMLEKIWGSLDSTTGFVVAIAVFNSIFVTGLLASSIAAIPCYVISRVTKTGLPFLLLTASSLTVFFIMTGGVISILSVLDAQAFVPPWAGVSIGAMLIGGITLYMYSFFWHMSNSPFVAYATMFAASGVVYGLTNL